MESRLMQRSLCPLFVLLVSGGSLVLAGDTRATIEQEQKWSAVFQDAEIELHFSLRTPDPFKGRVHWQLASREKRTLLRGESAVAAEPDKPGRLTVRLKVPSVKPGVILPLVLVLAIHGDDGKVAATLEKNLWVFPSDPFAERTQWLKDLKITLFDPAGKTREVLDKLHVPFEETRNVAALPELTAGMVLVGEGVSFAEYRDLPEALLKTAAKGLPVLCLAPEEGTFPLPAAEALPGAPSSVMISRNEIITKLDKRLDAEGWGVDGNPIVGSLSVKVEDGNMVAEVRKDRRGWPWLDVQFPRRGRLIVCGFGVIQHGDANPTPRFLLAGIFTLLDVKTPERSEER
jgi:hypothetical protein